MELANEFSEEINSIIKRFNNGLSNTSTKKFDDLIVIAEKISSVPQEDIYITAAASRASNLWNRLAQGKPLNTHYTLAIGIIGEADLNSGLAPAKTFIGDGNGRYDAICLVTQNNNVWEIAAILERKDGGIHKAIQATYPNIKIEFVESKQVETQNELYSDEMFLDEVYISEEKLQLLKNILLKKKNLIIQGAPGVGKSFTAKRLAYAIMEEKDDSRILNIQFHQSYSYEDFIMGYRPNDSGFEIKAGPFFEFCEFAKDKEAAYFIIIDEINRGNMSRIFGELLMLIENDKRGQKLKLLYQNDDEDFFVPDNLYIIGMMNTADRSLAMIDYALRRRFAFFDFPPAFNSEGFIKYQQSFSSNIFDKVVECVNQLNTDIRNDESLGEGFRIGHSYFCNMDTADEIELAGIIEYEIIPLLKEYWFDDMPKVQLWTDKLRGAING